MNPDLLGVTRELINPAVSRAGLGVVCAAMLPPSWATWSPMSPTSRRRKRHSKTTILHGRSGCPVISKCACAGAWKGVNYEWLH